MLMLAFLCFRVKDKKCLSLAPILFPNSFMARDTPCHIGLFDLRDAWLHYVSLFFMTCRK